jgi:hypothetical protein
MDEFFLTKGRQLLQEAFQAKLQERIQRTEADCPTYRSFMDRCVPDAANQLNKGDVKWIS